MFKPLFFKVTYNLTGYLAIAFAFSATIYAHAYFGKKTAVTTGLFSTLGLATGKILMFVYNIIFNNVTSAQIVSGALTYFIEILFDLLIIIVSLIISFTFARKRVSSVRDNAEKLYSPLSTSFFTSIVYVLILIIDLSAMNVIPFLIQSESIISEDVKNIILDYAYYLAVLPVLMVSSALAMYLLKKVTGKLKLKQYYEKKTQEKDK